MKDWIFNCLKLSNYFYCSNPIDTSVLALISACVCKCVWTIQFDKHANCACVCVSTELERFQDVNQVQLFTCACKLKLNWNWNNWTEILNWNPIEIVIIIVVKLKLKQLSGHFEFELNRNSRIEIEVTKLELNWNWNWNWVLVAQVLYRVDDRTNERMDGRSNEWTERRTARLQKRRAMAPVASKRCASESTARSTGSRRRRKNAVTLPGTPSEKLTISKWVTISFTTTRLTGLESAPRTVNPARGAFSTGRCKTAPSAVGGVQWNAHGAPTTIGIL